MGPRNDRAIDPVLDLAPRLTSRWPSTVDENRIQIVQRPRQHRADDHDPRAGDLVQAVGRSVAPARHIRLSWTVHHQRSLQRRIAQLRINEPRPAPVGGIRHGTHHLGLLNVRRDLNHLTRLDICAHGDRYLGQGLQFAHTRIILEAAEEHRWKDGCSVSGVSRPTVLLLDAGGVLLANNMTAVRKFTAVKAGVALTEVDDFWESLRRPLWTGNRDEAELWVRWEERFGREIARQAPRLARESLRPLARARAALQLPARRRILSNHLSAWLLPALRSHQFLDRVEDVAVSDATGVCKPDREAFAMALERAEVTGAEVLFVDDQQRNLDAASRLGIRTLLADPVGAWVARVGKQLKSGR